MVTIAPAPPTEGPPLLPPRLSLLDAADIAREDYQGRFIPGSRFVSPGCGEDVERFDPCDADYEKPEGEDGEEVEVDPFPIVAVMRCKARTGWSAEDYTARARTKLEACQAKQIEQELWLGTTIPTNPYLASLATEHIPTGLAGLEPPVALACLEQGLRDCGCGGPGMIHATPSLVTSWKGNGYVDRRIGWKGDLLYTGLDTIVVPGSGYDGSRPTGAPAAAGTQWAYATSIVKIRLGPITTVPPIRGGPDGARQAMSEALNRQNNRVRFYAERMATVEFDPCCAIGVRVNVQGCSVGS